MEFVQKHFQVPVTRTKILEENGCAGVVMMHEPSGSLLEISTLGGKVEFRAGAGIRWTVEGATAPELFGRITQELLETFAGRRAGPWGKAPDTHPHP